jgi:hypothetical protein
VVYVDENLMLEFVIDLKDDSFVVDVDFDLMLLNLVQDFPVK